MAADLRSFLRAAEEAGRVRRVRREVDPDANMGELCSQSDNPLLFESVKGYPGWRVAAALMQGRVDQALALGCSTGDVVSHLAARFAEGPGEIARVSRAPVKAKKFSGGAADLFRLPVCRHSEEDGGRYIGAGISLVRDPTSGVQNTTYPRTQLLPGRHPRVFISSRHTWEIINAWRRQGHPRMPMALVIGHHPAYEVAAGYSGEHPGWGEEALAPRLLGEPLEVIECETCDLLVPAAAEIVVEGELKLTDFEEEGPFGNYMGNYEFSFTPSPVFEVRCITMREDAYYRHIQSTTWTDHQSLFCMQTEALVYRACREAGLEVHDVHIPPWGCACLTVVQMTPRHEEDVARALDLAVKWPITPARMSKLGVAVDRDVDIYDARDVWWAVSVRANTRRAVLEILDPEKRSQRSHRLGIDATCPPPKNERQRFFQSKARPCGWGKVRLEDFLAPAGS
ncbi:MAG: UbiD family decarboxylase [Candidatus Tectomicrobia bacterium]|nr:UbiD family decarboxylase [Candidatus Tectomicrobia bacterium]